jgi:hypothetical protein
VGDIGQITEEERTLGQVILGDQGSKFDCRMTQGQRQIGNSC